MAGLPCGKGRVMIDSVVWTQYINVTDRHIDSHVAIENAAQRTASGGNNSDLEIMRTHRMLWTNAIDDTNVCQFVCHTDWLCNNG